MQRIPEYMIADVFRAMRAVPMHPEYPPVRPIEFNRP